MQNGDAIAETLLEASGENRRERDLRHQQQGLLPAPDDVSHHLDVHLRLSASGDAFQEKRSEGAEF